VYVDRPDGLPTAIFINDEAVAGPFCARCGHPSWNHRYTDRRCPKFAASIPGIHPMFRWGWLCEDCRPPRMLFFTESEDEANDHSDKHKHSLARCTAERAAELKEERRARA
jgi:hypothetical protein